jgi:hypothetical protein
MDKFMYASLKEGFKASRLPIKTIPEPIIITNIQAAMNLSLC